MLGRSQVGRHRIGRAARRVIGVGSLLTLAATFWLAVAVTTISIATHWKPTVMSSGSMAPALEVGDIVISSGPTERFGVGSVIVFDDPAGGGLRTHRIVDVTPQGRWVTRGDANGAVDSTPVHPARIRGEARLVVPFVGAPIVWYRHQEWVKIAAALVAALGLAHAARWGLRTPADPADDQRVAWTERRRSSARRTAIGATAVIGSVLVAGAGVALAFTGTSTNTANTYVADTLDAPTSPGAVGGGDVTLSWTATADTYATGHRVLRSASPGGPYTQIAQVTPRTNTSYVDSPGTGTYYYVIRSYFANWESADSAEVSATVAAPAYVATWTGSSSVSSTVTSSTVTAVADDLYLAAVSMKSSRVVTSVSGLGLTWTLVDAQCAGRDQTSVEVWMAQGTPSGDGTVTATMDSAPTTAVIAVSRYSGVDPVDPIGAVVSANTNGTDGACSGGTDSAPYSQNITTTESNVTVYGAIGLRNRTHTPGTGFTERVDFNTGTGGGDSGLAVQDVEEPTVTTRAIDGTLSSAQDWAMIGIEILP